MLLEQTNEIGFHRAFTFDGTFITTHDDPVPSIELLGDGTWEWEFSGWEPVTGHSGQDRYNGPIMHESEQFSPNVLQAMHDKYGPHSIYGLAIVESWDDEYEEYDAAGWIILVQVGN